ncbi:sensor histidine kinase [Amycolatopsis pigmentata]|uniref:histidine kinase n=1 Tax=Amycolatopsis pigmentata TaxID=450801 RepID=A0ABW5G4Q5_9PSEU
MRMWRLPTPVTDAVSAVLVTALLLLGAIGESYPMDPSDRIPPDAVPPPAAYLLVVFAGLVLIRRRRWPVPVFWLSLVAVLTYTVMGYVNGAALIAPVIALYTIAAEGTLRRTAFYTAATIGSLVGTSALFGPYRLGGGTSTVAPFVIAASVFLGLAVANRRAYVAEVIARAEHAERTREEEAKRQVDAERLRIARELHDVVAHTMATINVQAAAAGHVLDEQPAQAAEALRFIKSASKEGLRELRAILTVLRQCDEAEPTQPAPGLAQLDALVTATCRAGLPTTLRIIGDRRPLLPAAELAAYRIVQESLTNTIRHAGTATATIMLRFGDDRLDIDVTDTGPAMPFNGSGHGLRGMAERAAAVGGSLDAGPGPDGGFRVRARIPA